MLILGIIAHLADQLCTGNGETDGFCVCVCVETALLKAIMKKILLSDSFV